MTWFRVGGPAEVLFRPADLDDLAQFLADKPDDVPVTVIGVGSNLLMRDGGMPGVVDSPGPRVLRNPVVPGDAAIGAGAGALDVTVAIRPRRRRLRAGVPVRHSGHHRRRVAHERRCVRFGNEGRDRNRRYARCQRAACVASSLAELGLTYRHSAVAEDWIFLSAVLHGTHR